MDSNPLNAPGPFSGNYVGSARIDLGNTTRGAPSTPKVYRSVEVAADSLVSGYQYGKVYYQLNECGSFALLGQVNESPVSELFFSGGEGSFVTGNSIEISIQSFTASPAYTPIYRSVVLRGALRPNSIDEITAQIRIADGIRDHQKGEMKQGANMLADLRALAKQNSPTTLIDLTGAPWSVNVLPPVQEQEYYQKGDDYPEIMATVKMSVLTFS
jgi:hypothetical protein